MVLASLFYTLGAQIQDQSYKLLLKGLLSHSVPEVSVTEAMTVGEEAIFLDARAKKEFDVSHLKGARFVGYDDFDLTAVKDIPKDKKVVVYCSIGYRSEKIAEQLIAAGYSDVSNLFGGVFEWKNQGHEVYNTAGETEQVHAFDKTWGIWLRKGEKVYD